MRKNSFARLADVFQISASSTALPALVTPIFFNGNRGVGIKDQGEARASPAPTRPVQFEACNLEGMDTSLGGSRGRSAVLMLNYNRPDFTLLSLQAIRKHAPAQLFLVCDGPKQEPGDSQRVELVKQILTSEIDEIRDVRHLFLAQNHGAKIAMETALDWFFDNVESGIVLEDDCVAEPGFFVLAEHFLDRFRDESDVWGMTGSNTAGLSFPESYGFVRASLTWGWATWANRWSKHRTDFSTFVEAGNRVGHGAWPTKGHKVALERHLRSQIKNGVPDAWDYLWSWTVMSQGGVWGVSSEHLVKNIGFREDSSNTGKDIFKSPPLGSLTNIIPASTTSPNIGAEERVLRKIHGLRKPLWVTRLVNTLRALVRAIH